MPHTEPPRTPVREPHAGVGHEPDAVNARGILWFAFWLIVIAVVIQIGLYGLLKFFQGSVGRRQAVLPASVQTSLKRTPAAPRLEALPLSPRRALNAQEDERLSTYGWVNRAGGVARIPIDRAMQIIVERGVPGGKPLPQVPQTTPAGSPPAPASGQGVLQ